MSTEPYPEPPSATDIWTSVLNYAPDFLEVDRAVSRQPGYQCAVGIDGELTGAFSGGYAHLGSDSALTNEHLFRIASHSKTFTATATMILCQDGALSLEDQLGDLIPALAGSEVSGVRVRELLSHSGGIIRDSENADFWVLGRPFPLAEELLEIAKTSKVLERNEHFKYTNIGYGLLGLVIEAASNRSFAEFINERILGPLGLENTGVDLDRRATELAAGYGPLVLAGNNHSLDGRTEIEHIHTGALAAATGFYSNASDMVGYFSSHLLGTALSVLEDDSKRLMQRKAEESGVAGRGYGLGFIIQQVHGRDTFGHSGGYPGHITRSWAVPETGVVLSMLTNAVDGKATAWGEQLFALAALAEQPTPGSYAGVEPGILSRFTGRFAALWGLQDVVELGGKLFLLEPGAAVDPKNTMPLEFVDGQTLKSADPNGFGGYGELVHFDFDERVASALRGPGGMRFVRQEDFLLPDVLGPAG